MGADRTWAHRLIQKSIFLKASDEAKYRISPGEGVKTLVSGYIVFMTHDGYIRQDAVFARQIRQRAGIGSIAVVHGRRNYLMAERQEAFDRIVDLVQGFDPSHADHSLARNLSRLAEIERRTGEATIMQDVFQDRWLLGRFDLAYIVAYLAHAADVLESVLSGDVRAVIGEMTMAVYRLARRLAQDRAPYLFPIGARFFPRFYFEDSLYMEWHRCRAAYRHFMQNGIPSELRAEVEPVLNDIVERQATPAMFVHLKPNPGAGSEPIRTKLRWERLEKNLSYWRYDFPETAHNPRVLASAWEMLPHSKLLRWANERRVIRWFRSHAIDTFPADIQFCTYFMHYQPEYTVEGIGYPFADQRALIRTIAQSLPLGVWLLVKEQPFMLGLRPRSYYEQILSLPNVRLVSEKANSRDLIRNSKIVFTISGTAALEAMFYGVPAVLFGRVFHATFEGITLVRDLYSLSDVVHSLLKHGCQDNRRSALAALAAMYVSSYPGQLASLFSLESHLFHPENQVKLGAALQAELESRGLLAPSEQGLVLNGVTLQGGNSAY